MNTINYKGSQVPLYSVKCGGRFTQDVSGLYTGLYQGVLMTEEEVKQAGLPEYGNGYTKGSHYITVHNGEVIKTHDNQDNQRRYLGKLVKKLTGQKLA